MAYCVECDPEHNLGRFILTVGGLPSNLLKMLEVMIYSLHRIVLV